MATQEETVKPEQKEQQKEQQKGQQKREDNKEKRQREDNKDKKQREGGNNKKKNQDKVQYVVKGEKGEQVEGKEQQEEHEQKPKQKKERRERQRPQFDWDRSKVTLETVIPELPKKPHEKPNKEAHFKLLDKIDEDIKKVRDQFTQFKKDYREEQDLARQGKQEKFQNEVKPLGMIVGEKIKLVQVKRKEFNGYKEEFDKLKEQLNVLNDQGQHLRQKMKSLESPEKILKELGRLRESLKFDKLTATEEKKILVQINNLERTIPYIEPLEKLEKEMEVIRVKQRGIRKVMNPAYDEIQALEADIKAAKEDYDKLKDVTKDENYKNQTNPILDAKKKDVDAKVVELKEKKERIKKEYNDAWDKYEDYEDLKRYHDWVAKQKERLTREAEKKKREEQRKAREEARAKREADKLAKEQQDKQKEQEEEQQQDENPFSYQIELCDVLISYCQKLKPVHHQVQEQQKPQVDIQKVLQSDEWKKEKVTVVGQNDEEEELYKFSTVGKGKKRKNQKQQQQTEQKEEKKPQLIPHDIQTIQFFDTIKVGIPLTVKDLDNTIKGLEDRKAYYVKVNANPDEYQEEEQEQPKEQKVQQKQKDNGEDFPALN